MLNIKKISIWMLILGLNISNPVFSEDGPSQQENVSNFNEMEVLPTWTIRKLRFEAFNNTKVFADFSKGYFKNDPRYYSNRDLAIQLTTDVTSKGLNNAVVSLVPAFLKNDALKDALYQVCQNSGKCIIYDDKGKTLGISFKTDSYPAKSNLYQYSSGKLLVASYWLSPQDFFVFDANGNLLSSVINDKPVSADELQQQVIDKSAASKQDPLWGQPTFDRKVHYMGQKILSENDIKEMIAFKVQDEENGNAYAFEDSNDVIVTTRMLKLLENDDELAFVLSHEIAHIILKHSSKKVALREQTAVEVNKKLNRERRAKAAASALGTGVAAFFTLGAALPVAVLDYAVQSNHMKLQQEQIEKLVMEEYKRTFENQYQQKFEIEADQLGVKLMDKARFNTAASTGVLKKISGDGTGRMWASHPSGTDRLNAVNTAISELDASKKAFSCKKGAPSDLSIDQQKSDCLENDKAATLTESL